MTIISELDRTQFKIIESLYDFDIFLLILSH